ncbi:MAG TPA: hypothetical protein VGX68_00970 [Thermoanaerobaculia bacterium]|jgi:hypothetical protein|nr:hypothetical protein [Thermoanaerobaculia bacterium]
MEVPWMLRFRRIFGELKKEVLEAPAVLFVLSGGQLLGLERTGTDEH